MATVLFIKANDRPADQAVSVRMYETFLKAYRESHPEDTITEVDLFGAGLPYYGNTTLAGLYKAGQGIEATAEEKEAAAIATRYLEQFLASDKLVIAFPLWNYTVPGPLVTYLSYLLQAGKTFKYTAEGPVGLASEKKVALLNARGGDYSLPGMEEMEMSLKLVRTSLGLMGITSPEAVVIEGHAMYPDRAADIVADGLERAAKLAAAF